MDENRRLFGDLAAFALTGNYGKLINPPSPLNGLRCWRDKPAFAPKRGYGGLSGRGEIGRRTRLRIWRREAWGFESLRPHNFLVIGLWVDLFI